MLAAGTPVVEAVLRASLAPLDDTDRATLLSLLDKVLSVPVTD